MAHSPSPDDPLDRDSFYDSTADEPELELADDGFGASLSPEPTAPKKEEDVVDLHAAVGDDEADDDDYELEPVDAAILEGERKRAEEEIVRAETSLDIDQVYQDQSGGAEDLDEYFTKQFDDFKFQFQVKHLLMGTAALAVVLSLGRLTGSGFAALMMVVFVLLIAANAYLGWRDRKREAALAAKRERLVALAREGEAAALGGGSTVDGPAMYDEELEEEDEEPKRPTLKFQFSTKEVLVTMTVACALFGLLSVFGTSTVAVVLGLVAIAGLVAFAVGVELPAVVALGWWLVLLLYLVVSAISTLTADAGQ